MATSIHDHLMKFSAEADAIAKLVEIVSSEEQYLEFLERYFKKESERGAFTKATPISILRQGNFTDYDFSGFLFMLIEGQSHFTAPAVAAFLARLIDAGVVIDNYVVGLDQSSGITRYHWGRTNLSANVRLNAIDNIMYGSYYLPIKYKPSIPAVIVRKEGDEFIGTAFLTSNFTDGRQKVIITAKHNVDPEQGVDFLRYEFQSGAGVKNLRDEWILHDELDIALMPVESDSNIPVIYFNDDLAVLCQVVSLGYPSVSTANSPFLLAHSGEINGIITNYEGTDLAIISNLVSPGSSGGPVLDKRGLCVGMVISSLERQFLSGNSSFNAALPSKYLSDFVRDALE